MKKSLVLVLTAVLSLSFGAKSWAEENAAAIDLLFETGIKAIEDKDYKRAAEQFNRILELNPSSTTALKLREQVGYQQFLDYAKEMELRDVAFKILDLAAIGERRNLRDPEVLEPVVKALKGNDADAFKRRWMRWSPELDRPVGAITQLGYAGQFAIPVLAKHLKGEEDVSNRAFLVRAAMATGYTGVMPAIELLRSSDEKLVTQAILILGEMKDTRAIPYLLHVVINGNDEQKRTAGEALAKIKQYHPIVETDPATAFSNLALKYLFSPAVRSEARQMEGIIWKLGDEDQLSYTELPQSVYGEIMAEKVCWDALQYYPSDYFNSLMCAIKTEQFVRSREFLAIANDKAFSGSTPVPEGLKIFYDERLESLNRVPQLLPISGQNTLLHGLEILLANDASLGASYLMDSLSEVVRGDALYQDRYRAAEMGKTPAKDWFHRAYPNLELNSLVQALNNKDLVVRAKATLMAIELNPTLYFPGSQFIQRNIADILKSHNNALITGLANAVSDTDDKIAVNLGQVIPAFQNMMDAPELSVDTKKAMIGTLVSKGDNGNAALLARVALESGNTLALRLAALDGIGEYETNVIGERLKPLLKDPSREIRLAASAAMGRNPMDSKALSTLLSTMARDH